jgi:hypothetical protein
MERVTRCAVIGFPKSNDGKGVTMKKATILGCLALLVFGSVVVAGCGSSGSSVEGVYKVEAGGKTVSVLTLKADSKGTISLIEDSNGIPITYKVKDDTVVLIGVDGKTEAGNLKIVDGGLKDSATGILYKKQ